MSLEFLTDQWFTKVAEVSGAAAAAGLEIPPAMKDVVVNLTVETPRGSVQMCMEHGFMVKGHREKADVEMQMPADYAERILVVGDWSAGMKGYIARKIKVSGNMRKLIPLQVYKPTPSQVTLRQEIERLTSPAGQA
jgi:hypothetical protein